LARDGWWWVFAWPRAGEPPTVVSCAPLCDVALVHHAPRKPPTPIAFSTLHIGPTLPTGLPCGSVVCGPTARLSPPRPSQTSRAARAMIRGASDSSGAAPELREENLWPPELLRSCPRRSRSSSEQVGSRARFWGRRRSSSGARLGMSGRRRSRSGAERGISLRSGAGREQSEGRGDWGWSILARALIVAGRRWCHAARCEP
jgi:hypothetical protein